MKVLLVDQFGKTAGRDTLALAELINQNQEIDMTVYLSDTTEIPSDQHYTVAIKMGFHGAYEGNAFNKASNYLKALKELRKYIEENHFDVVHLQWFSLPWIEWIYVSMLKKLCKIVITVHDVIPFDKRPLEMQSLDKIYSRANALVLHTETNKDLFKRKYKASTPITVVSQAFCLKSDYHQIDSCEAKQHFGIHQNAVVFLYYGTIRPSKGLDILIKSISDAHRQNENVYLLAAGAFHNVNEKEYYTLVKEYLNETFSSVHFEFVPHEEEKWYFSAADVLCLPYLEITQSGVAQRGLMYDLPIIATNVGEMKEVCRDAENGILISSGEQEELTRAIIKMSEDENFRKSAKLQSKNLGEKEFSLVTKSNQIIELYMNV